MAPTRILVTDMPRLQGELVAELLRGRADLQVIEPDARPMIEPEARLMTPCEEATVSRAHVVILGRDDPDTARELLEVLPRLVVLTIADRELVAWRYGLTPYRERLGELSPAAVAAGIQPREPLPLWWTS